jgi:hypothetical protein
MTVYLSLLAGAGAQFFTDGGLPLSGGKIYTYGAGTTTPAVTYTSNTGATPNSNPIILDSAGRPPAEIWLTSGLNYKFVIKTSTDVDIRTYDNISGGSDNSAVMADLANTSDIAKGDALVGFKQANSSGVLGGATAATVHSKLQDVVSVRDFGAVGNGSTNDAAAFAVASANGGFYIPPGTYRIGTNTALTSPVSFAPGAKIVVDNGVTFTFVGTQTAVPVQAFGAVGNGTTNDSPAFQAAINSGAPVFVPFSASGYSLATTVSLPASSSITGDSFSTIISRVSTSAFAFEITGDDVDISGLRIDCSNVSGGTGAIRIRSDLGDIKRISIKNIFTYRSNFGLRDTAHATNLIIALTVSDFRMNQHQGPGFYFERAFAYIDFDFCTVDYVNSPVTPNFKAFSMYGNRGCIFSNCDTTGGTVTSGTLDNTGFFFFDCWNVWLNSCIADTLGGAGYDFSASCYYIIMQGCVASLCGKHGFAINGGNEFQLSACYTRGRADQTSPLANQNGFNITSTDRIVMTGCKVVLATGSGYYVNTVTRANITGSRTDLCTGWGVNSAGTNGVLFASMGFDVCTAGNASFSSAGMFLTSSVSNSGALINLTGPGTI